MITANDNIDHYCPHCLPWCATSERQWQNRQRNMADHPSTVLGICPVCGGTSWATTRRMIRPEPLNWGFLVMLLYVLAFWVLVFVGFYFKWR